MRDISSSEAGALSMTQAHVIEAIACLSPPNAATAAAFCELMHNIVVNAGSSGCTTIHHAGAISVIFGCLRSWLDENEVVQWSCRALSSLVLHSFGGTDVKQAMRDVPDYEELLKTVESARLFRFGDACKLASSTLLSL